jgi:hypothetical protein
MPEARGTPGSPAPCHGVGGADADRVPVIVSAAVATGITLRRFFRLRSQPELPRQRTGTTLGKRAVAAAESARVSPSARQIGCRVYWGFGDDTRVGLW